MLNLQMYRKICNSKKMFSNKTEQMNVYYLMLYKILKSFSFLSTKKKAVFTDSFLV